MGTVSSSTDPVRTLLDILENTTDGNWPSAGGKPEYIEKQSETDQNTKTNRKSPGAYVYSPSEGTITAFDGSGDAFEDEQIVNVDFWTPEGFDHAAELSGDLRNILMPAYWTDNYTLTNWQYVRPEAEDDIRQESPANLGGQHRIITRVRLFADRDL